MKAEMMSETSTTKFEAAEAESAFLTFRVTGDKLTPAEITKILRVPPVSAYSKGEKYSAGPRSMDLVGKTCVWYLSTDILVASNQLVDHLGVLLRILSSPHDNVLPIAALHALMKKK